MNHPPESLLRKLNALLEMARRGGSENEKMLAAQRLDKLLIKHDLTLEDIDPSTRKTYWFNYKTKADRILLDQIHYMVTNEDLPYYVNKATKKMVLGYDLTKAEYIEMDRLYLFWRKELKAELERCISAFIQANEIFGDDPDEDDEPERTPEEWAEIEKMLKMAAAMEAKKPFHLLNGENQ